MSYKIDVEKVARKCYETGKVSAGQYFAKLIFLTFLNKD